MLIPMFCPAASQVRSITFVGSNAVSAAANTTPTLSLPSGAAAGDLCVIQYGSLATAGTAIPGFTLIAANQTSGGRQNVLSWKLLTPSDISTGSISAQRSTSAVRTSIAVFKPDKPITDVTVLGIKNGTNKASSVVTQTIPSSAGLKPFVVVAAWYTAGSVAASATMNGTLTTTGVKVAGTISVYGQYYRIFNSADTPVDLTIGGTGTDSTSGASNLNWYLESCYIQLS